MKVNLANTGFLRMDSSIQPTKFNKQRYPGCSSVTHWWHCQTGQSGTFWTNPERNKTTDALIALGKVSNRIETFHLRFVLDYFLTRWDSETENFRKWRGKRPSLEVDYFFRKISTWTKVLHLHFHRNFRNFSIMEQSPESTSLINAFRKVMKSTFKLTENGTKIIISYMRKRPAMIKLFKI